MLDFYPFSKEEYSDDDSTIFYSFKTNYNIIYTVYFTEGEYNYYLTDYVSLLTNSYSFGFRKTSSTNDKKHQKDEIIFNTIYQIILNFFEDVNRFAILLYHCDTADNRQAARSRLFDKWEGIILNTNLVKYCLNVQTNKTEYYLGFITNQTNPEIENIKLEFDSFCKKIVNPK